MNKDGSIPGFCTRHLVAFMDACGKCRIERVVATTGEAWGMGFGNKPEDGTNKGLPKASTSRQVMSKK